MRRKISKPSQHRQRSPRGRRRLQSISEIRELADESKEYMSDTSEASADTTSLEEYLSMSDDLIEKMERLAKQVSEQIIKDENHNKK